MPLDEQSFERLKKLAKLDEAYEVTTIKGYRTDSLGSGREITLEIWDGGPSTPHRYHVIARDEDGRVATGNPEADLDLAMQLVHWRELEHGQPDDTSP